MTWIVRILLLIAAPVAALIVGREELNFGIVQVFVAMLLIVAVLALVAIRPNRKTPNAPSAQDNRTTSRSDA